MTEGPILTEGMQPDTGFDPASRFGVAAYNDTGFLWETREPGVDKEETWEDGEHEFSTLTAAVERVLPQYARYGLTLDNAARLLIDVGMIRHTGVERPLEDDNEEE